MAQNAGEAAVQMNRYFPGVHKYIALAQQKESGDLDAAIATMNRAVLYEAPGDAHLSDTKRLFKELKSSNN